jgi:AAA domain, putative AbiEii toxin, Type IV TA system
VTLSRLPGSSISLYVGETQTEPALVPDERYIAELRSLRSLQGEGDGIRSFMGIMLTLVTASYPVFVLDEPEAFLHPPQARLLGRKLAAEATGQAQVIIATHSIDVVEGLLSEGGANVSVVRMTRSEKANHVSVLNPSDLREVWDDPLLRYSRLLDGLFHRGVILCEGDSDARYYGAHLDELSSGGTGSHELLITHCGGKQRLAMAIRSLRAIGVPIAVIADLDLLRERQRVADVVTALGGDWAPHQKDWMIVDSAVRGLAHNPSADYVREQLSEILGASAGALTREQSDRIRQVIRVESGWSSVKRGGMGELPQGDASDRGAHLLEALKGIGLFLVPVGELERWEPQIPGEGVAWVSEALERRTHEQADSAGRRFVREVLGSFAPAARGSEAPIG